MHDLGVSKFMQIGQAPRCSQSDQKPAFPIQRIVWSYTCTNQASSETLQIVAQIIYGDDGSS